MLLTINSESSVNLLLSKAYAMFEKGSFEDSQRLLRKAHTLDFEDPEICSALKACGYWIQRKRFMYSTGLNYPRGEFLRKQWNDFSKVYVENFEDSLVEGRKRLSKWVHKTALGYFREAISKNNDTELILAIGRCYKALGNYEEATHVFRYSFLGRRLSTDSRILAELADTYALMGKMVEAKVMMREALFINPEKIDLQEIASPIFKKLIERTISEGISPDEPCFLSWMGVYGNLWGVLDVKRELNQNELNNLRKNIHNLYNRFLDDNENSCLIAKLINHYLWLLDSNRNIEINSFEIDEALLNIKILSRKIYNLYIS